MLFFTLLLFFISLEVVFKCFIYILYDLVTFMFRERRDSMQPLTFWTRHPDLSGWTSGHGSTRPRYIWVWECQQTSSPYTQFWWRRWLFTHRKMTASMAVHVDGFWLKFLAVFIENEAKFWSQRINWSAVEALRLLNDDSEEDEFDLEIDYPDI